MNLYTIYTILLCTILCSKILLYSPGNLVYGTPNPGKTGESASQSSKVTSDGKKLVEVDIAANQTVTYGYDYRELSRHNAYTAREKFGINLVKKGSIIIWKADNDENYCTAVVLENKTKLKIHTKDGNVKEINQGDPEWPEDESEGCINLKCILTCGFYYCICKGSVWNPDQSVISAVDQSVKDSKKTPFVLSLDQETSNNQYDYIMSKDGKTKTYSVKDNYAIREVMWLQSLIHFGRADRKIWKTYDPIYYANKVIVIDLSSWKLDLTIELFNGINLKYYRPAAGSKWTYKGSEKPENKNTNTKDGKKTTPINQSSTTTTPSSGGGTDGSQATTPTSQTGGGTHTDQSGTPTSRSGTDGSGGATGTGHSGASNMKELQASEHPNNIKITTDGSSKENDTSKYTVKQNENNKDEFLYEFKTDSKCTTVKCDEKEVWKYDSTKHSEKYPLSMKFNKKDSKIVLTFNGLVINCEKDSNGNWTSTETGTETLKEVEQTNHPKDVKIITPDPDDSSKTKENDHTQYKVYKTENDKDKLYKYVLNENDKCSEIKLTIKKKDPKDHSKEITEDSTVWKHEENKSTDYPKAIYYLDQCGIFFIEFSEDKFQFYRKPSGKQWQSIELKGVKELKKDSIKIKTKNIAADFVDLETSKYKVRELGFGYQYIFEDNANCAGLVYESNYIYQYERNDDNGKYPLAIYFLSNKACQVVYETKFYYIAPD